MKTENLILNLQYKCPEKHYKIATRTNLGDKVTIEENGNLRAGEVLQVSPRGCNILFVNMEKKFVPWIDILEVRKDD